MAAASITDKKQRNKHEERSMQREVTLGFHSPLLPNHWMYVGKKSSDGCTACCFSIAALSWSITHLPNTELTSELTLI